MFHNENSTVARAVFWRRDALVAYDWQRRDEGVASPWSMRACSAANFGRTPYSQDGGSVFRAGSALRDRPIPGMVGIEVSQLLRGSGRFPEKP